jgi:hypothetical protein
MKPYKATYPDGATAYLTKEEAVFIVRTARNTLDPKPLGRSRAEARGLLALFEEEGLDGLYYENVTVTPRRSLFTVQNVHTFLTALAVLIGLTGVLIARFNILEATHSLALAAVLLLLRPSRV